jgi:hypothetical protein
LCGNKNIWVSMDETTNESEREVAKFVIGGFGK